MAYYSKYDWYQPSVRPQTQGYTPPPQQQGQQQQEDQSIDTQMLEEYLSQGNMTAPVESYGAGTPMVQGASYTPTAGAYSPMPAADPFTSGGLQQTAGADFFAGEGALGASEGMLGGEAALGGEAMGGGEGLMAGGGWAAALAAAIAWNEEDAREGGYRADSTGARLQDQLSGKVIEQDVDRWADKFGFEGTWGEDVLQHGADLATLDISNAFSGFEDMTKDSWDWLGGLF